MVPQPLVSVCIPSYNNADFIFFTLESVLKQTYRNFEIIISDSNSADATVSVARTFGDSRIKLIQNEARLGFGENWNKALSLAAGKYVKLLCADDLIYPDCLARQVEVLEDPSNSRAVLAVCSSDIINADNQIVLRRRLRPGPGLVSGIKLIRNCIRWGTNRIGEPATGLFKREVLTRSGVFDSSSPYLIDLMFWAALLKHGEAYMDKSRLAAFRVSPTSMSAKVGFRQAAAFREFIRKMHQDPVYHVGMLDVIAGSFLSLQWCILRNLFVSIQAGSRQHDLKVQATCVR